MIKNPLQRIVFLAFAALISTAVALGQGRVIVLGFDGADARTTERMMAEGQLPNLAKLAEQGTFAPLESTHPAESAAGWAALHTGCSPAENGVASFIVRGIQDGKIKPREGHVHIDPVSLRDVEGQDLFPRLVAKVGRWPLALGGFAVAFLGLLGLFRLLFAMGWRAAGVVAFGLAVVAGAGLWRAKSYLDIDIPDVFHNRVQKDGFWDYAARAGVESIVLDAALSFGRPETDGARVLGGLGLPDATGAVSGTWSVYTDDPLVGGSLPAGERAGSTGSGRLFLLSDIQGQLRGEIFGPIDATRRASVLEEWREVGQALDANTDMGFEERGRLDTRLRELEREGAYFGIRRDGTTAGIASNAARATLPLIIQRKDGGVDLTLGDQTQFLAEGAWSDWYTLTFPINPLVPVPAITRARLNSASDPLELYVHTFEMDPKRPLPWQPVSSPRGFASEAADWIGVRYETLGWSCMTNQLKDRRVPPEVFLEDIEFTMDWRARLTLAAMKRNDWRLLFSVYSTTDRVQHMMYRFHDADHPAHDAELAAKEVPFFGESTKLADAIPAIYRQMDERVGEVMAELQPDDWLILCADHGFTSFRRQVFVNNLLQELGFLHVKEGVQLAEGGGALTYVDWERTQAYALGLGMVYLNLKGREPEGIVAPEDARRVLEEVRAGLLSVQDAGPAEAPFPAPRSPVVEAEILWDLYPGDWQGTDYACADLMVGLGEFYRVAWSGVMGGMALEVRDEQVVPASAYRDNTNPWSGDHASNSPKLVTGIFFCNRKLRVPDTGLSVMHVAPTVLSALNVPPPESMDLPPVLLEVQND